MKPQKYLLNEGQYLGNFASMWNEELLGSEWLAFRIFGLILLKKIFSL